MAWNSPRREGLHIESGSQDDGHPSNCVRMGFSVRCGQLSHRTPRSTLPAAHIDGLGVAAPAALAAEAALAAVCIHSSNCPNGLRCQAWPAELRNARVHRAGGQCEWPGPGGSASAVSAIEAAPAAACGHPSNCVPIDCAVRRGQQSHGALGSTLQAAAQADGP